VPMIRHQTIRRNTDTCMVMRFVKDFLKGKIIGGLLK
jgi:hypothetical protein